MAAKKKGKNKRPKSIINISTEKKARGGSILDKEKVEEKKISWKFSIIDIDGKWTFKNNLKRVIILIILISLIIYHPDTFPSILDYFSCFN